MIPRKCIIFIDMSDCESDIGVGTYGREAIVSAQQGWTRSKYENMYYGRIIRTNKQSSWGCGNSLYQEQNRRSVPSRHTTSRGGN